jgi:hypothetical protein
LRTARIMSANESAYVVCHNGAFTLPEAIYKSLATLVDKGFVYLRQDDEVLTISTTRIAEGRRRVLNTRFRSPMFREAKTLAIVDYRESIRIMIVERRPTGRSSRERREPPAVAR